MESVPEKIEEVATPKVPDDNLIPGIKKEEEPLKVDENHIQDVTVPGSKEQAVEVSQEPKAEEKAVEPEVVLPADTIVQIMEQPVKPDGEILEEKKEMVGNGELVKQVPVSDIASTEQAEPDEPSSTSPVKEIEKVEEKEKLALVEEQSPMKPKYVKKQDSDSGISSTADNSSVDLNLSISSFISKSKEPGTISQQVRNRCLYTSCVIFYCLSEYEVESVHSPIQISVH